VKATDDKEMSHKEHRHGRRVTLVQAADEDETGPKEHRNARRVRACW
jgi:hypothetical protein